MGVCEDAFCDELAFFPTKHYGCANAFWGVSVFYLDEVLEHVEARGSTEKHVEARGNTWKHVEAR